MGGWVSYVLFPSNHYSNLRFGVLETSPYRWEHPCATAPTSGSHRCLAPIRVAANNTQRLSRSCHNLPNNAHKLGSPPRWTGQLHRECTAESRVTERHDPRSVCLAYVVWTDCSAETRRKTPRYGGITFASWQKRVLIRWIARLGRLRTARVDESPTTPTPA